jgi:hypothetical protein
MKEKLNELLEDFKGRIKNPLILSFLLVWLYKHWLLIYWIFTVDDNVSVYTRTNKILEYLKFKGIADLTINPLLISFISLAAYYLIANLAQVIQTYVGRRLHIWLLLVTDKSKTVLRTELDNEVAKNKNLKELLKKAESEINSLEEVNKEIQIEFNEEIRKHYETADKLAKTGDTVMSNTRFKERITIPLITLLGQANNIEVKGSKPNNTNENYALLKGSWNLNIYDSINNSSSEIRAINILENKISYFDDRTYGEIKKFVYDANHFILKITVERESNQSHVLDDPTFNEKYILIQIHTDLYEGLLGNFYVTFTRRSI